MSPVTVAAVQAAPEFLDRDATIGKVVCGHRVRHYRGNQPTERRQR